MTKPKLSDLHPRAEWLLSGANVKLSDSDADPAQLELNFNVEDTVSQTVNLVLRTLKLGTATRTVPIDNAKNDA